MFARVLEGQRATQCQCNHCNTMCLSIHNFSMFLYIQSRSLSDAITPTCVYTSQMHTTGRRSSVHNYHNCLYNTINCHAVSFTDKQNQETHQYRKSAMPCSYVTVLWPYYYLIICAPQWPERVVYYSYVKTRVCNDCNDTPLFHFPPVSCETFFRWQWTFFPCLSALALARGTLSSNIWVWLMSQLEKKKNKETILTQ